MNVESEEIDSSLLQLTLEEMRRSFDDYSMSASELNRKGNSLLGSGSLVVSLFGFLQLNLLQEGVSISYAIGLVLLILLYILLIIFSTSAILPKRYMNPISADLDLIGNEILRQSKSYAYKKVIASYVEQIHHNQAINDRKSCQLRAASWLLVAIVSIMPLVALLPR
jgi:hypothetical protein